MGLLAGAMVSAVRADCLDELLPRPRVVERGAGVELKLRMPVERPGWYRLEVKGGRPKISGDEEGRRYAQVTFGQLKKLAGKAKVPDCTIVDWPEFKYRGVLLDCGRNYQSVESIRDLIDHLAKYKMNVFHWHISDDYGWRLES